MAVGYLAMDVAYRMALMEVIESVEEVTSTPKKRVLGEAKMVLGGGFREKCYTPNNLILDKEGNHGVTH